MITISVPLTRADRQQAQALKDRNLATEQSEQIYQNALAVLATRRYLSMLDIPSDLKHRDVQAPDQALTASVADLYLPSAKGRLECHAVQIDENSCRIPEAAQNIDYQNDRIGYVVVRLSNTNTEATVLGFTKALEAELPLNQLQPLDDLIEAIVDPVLRPSLVRQRVTRLQEWLRNQVDDIWQSIEALPRGVIWARGEDATMQLVQQFLVSQSEPEIINLLEQSEVDQQTKLVQVMEKTQNEVTFFEAMKLLQEINPRHPAVCVQKAQDLGMNLNNNSVALRIAIAERENGRMAVFLQIYPVRELRFLPVGLTMTLLDGSGEIAREIKADTQDFECIELKFGVNQGTSFSVRVSVDGASVTENFVS